ncbi:Transposase, partial [Caligus rogercresseyi]
METPDYRSYFLFRIKLARTVNEIHGDLLSTFLDSCPGLSTLQRWHTEFDMGIFALEKKTRPGQENVTGVKRLVEDNPRMTTRQTSDGGFRAPKFPQRVPNKTQRMKCCQDHREDFLGSHLLARLGGAHRDPVLDPRVKQIARKTMILMGFTGKPRRVSITALPARTTADRKHNDRPEKDKIRLKDCLLMWDNARPHTATDTREFLTRRDVEPVKQSPYSPDLNLCDRFLFQKLKHLLWADEFGGNEEVTLAVQLAMRRFSEGELYNQ